MTGPESNPHTEMGETLKLARPQRRIARLIHRETDQVKLERDLTSWPQEAVTDWYRRIAETYDFVVYRLEWPAELEEAS